MRRKRVKPKEMLMMGARAKPLIPKEKKAELSNKLWELLRVAEKGWDYKRAREVLMKNIRETLRKLTREKAISIEKEGQYIIKVNGKSALAFIDGNMFIGGKSGFVRSPLKGKWYVMGNGGYFVFKEDELLFREMANPSISHVQFLIIPKKDKIELYNIGKGKVEIERVGA